MNVERVKVQDEGSEFVFYTPRFDEGYRTDGALRPRHYARVMYEGVAVKAVDGGGNWTLYPWHCVLWVEGDVNSA